MTSLLDRLKYVVSGKGFGEDTISSALTILRGNSTPPKRGTPELLKAYSTMPWLRGVVNKVSDSIAGVQWKVLVETRPDGKFVRNLKAQRGDYKSRSKQLKLLTKQGKLTEIENHPILDLLQNGNPFLTGLMNAKLNQSHIDLAGESFMLKERDGLNTIISLWPIPPHWIKAIPFPGQEFFEISFGGAVSEFVPMSEIIWIKQPDPFDPYGRGSSISLSLADELDADEYAAKHVKDFFFNGARPDIIVTAEGLSKGDTKRLEEQWNNKHQGFYKRFKTQFMNKKVEIHELKQDFKSMQMVDLRKFERDIIMQVYGVPPEIMGIIESSNRATIESADYIYSRWVLVPRLELQRSVYQERLVPEFDERIILDYESPVEEDKEHILDTIKSNPHAFTIDEIRDHVDFEEKDNSGGKVHMVPFNLQERKLDGSDDNSDSGDSVLPPNDTDDDSGNDSEKSKLPVQRTEDVPGRIKEVQDSTTKQINNVEQTTPAEQSPDVGKGRYREDDEGVTSEGVGSDNIDNKPVHGAEIDPFIRKAFDEFDVEEVTDEVDPRFIMALLAPVLLLTITEFGQSVINQAGLDMQFDDLNPRIDDFVNNESFERIDRLVGSTTKEKLKVQLLAGIKNNESLSQMAERVKSVFKDGKDARSLTIARTELVRTSNFATVEGMKQAQIDQKMWLSARDTNVRDTHQVGLGLDGQTIPVTANFVSPSGATGPHPGALGSAAEDINCRCTVVPVFDDKMVFTEGTKSTMWKSFESERAPFELQAKAAIVDGLTEQEKAVLDKLTELFA